MPFLEMKTLAFLPEMSFLNIELHNVLSIILENHLSWPNVPQLAQRIKPPKEYSLNLTPWTKKNNTYSLYQLCTLIKESILTNYIHPKQYWTLSWHSKKIHQYLKYNAYTSSWRTCSVNLKIHFLICNDYYNNVNLWWSVFVK